MDSDGLFSLLLLLRLDQHLLQLVEVLLESVLLLQHELEAVWGAAAASIHERALAV